MDSKRLDRMSRRDQTRSMAAQAFVEALVRFDTAGSRVLELSGAMAARPREDAVVAGAKHGLGFFVTDPLQLAAVHAWEEFLSAFYAALNRFAAFLALLVDPDTAQRLSGVRMKVWLVRLSDLFPNLAGEIHVLETARIHRGKWIDHPQVAGAALDWFTTQTRSHGLPMTVPVRIKAKPGPLYFIWNGGMANPWQVGYGPPVECERVGVPPCPVCLARALLNVVRVTSERYGHNWDSMGDVTFASSVHDCLIPEHPPDVPDSKLGRWTCPDCGQRWQLWRRTNPDTQADERFWWEVDFWPEHPSI